MAYTKEQIGSAIDHTILKPDATPADIEQLCAEALEYSFASCCVNPTHVKLANSLLAKSQVKVCTVIGFPLGANLPRIKYKEAEIAIAQGAREIDMVINIGNFIAGKTESVFEEIKILANICHKSKSILKVIVETCLLNNEQKAEITKIVERAGADFIKTSTGFSTSGATIEDILIFKENIKGDLKIKASGGIRDLEFAIQLLDAGANRLGTSSGIKIINAI